MTLQPAQITLSEFAEMIHQDPRYKKGKLSIARLCGREVSAPRSTFRKPTTATCVSRGQRDLLDTDGDFTFLEDLVPRLPNLNTIGVSGRRRWLLTDDWQPPGENLFMSMKRWRPMEFPLHNICDNDQIASARHLRALLRGVEKAGNPLQSIEASYIHLNILCGRLFGLHGMPATVLEHLSTLSLHMVAWDGLGNGLFNDGTITPTAMT